MTRTGEEQAEESTLTAPVGELDERYGKLRIVQPQQERAVRDSLRRLGQLMPLVGCERGSALVVVDGFKRVHAARVLGLATLRVRVMPLCERAALAAIVSLNHGRRGLSDLEEALVLAALCGEHGLSQVQVAELMGRHKSWVSRRLSLVQRLAPAVADDVRVGLLSTTVAREVARLPRGNQAAVAAAITRSDLTSKDAARLVTLFEKTSGAVPQRYLLEHPREALEAHGPRIPLVAHDPRLGPLTQALRQRLYSTMRAMSDVTARLEECTPARWTAAERQVLSPVVAQAKGLAQLLGDKLASASAALETSHAA